MNILTRLFPAYFGVPKATDIDAKCLANALSQRAALLTDRDILNGQIAGFEAIILRLTP